MILQGLKRENVVKITPCNLVTISASSVLAQHARFDMAEPDSALSAQNKAIRLLYGFGADEPQAAFLWGPESQRMEAGGSEVSKVFDKVAQGERFSLAAQKQQCH